MIPISFVPHDPDHSGVIWTEKPHPLPEVIMSKETGKPLVVGPSSPPSDGGNPNTMLPVSSTSVSPWSITGSSRLKGNDSTGSTGTTVPTPPRLPTGRSIPLLSAHAATLVVIVSACLSRWFQRPAL